MGGSIQIARVFGIPVKLHWSFFLLFGALGLLGWAQSGSFIYLVSLLLFFLSVFFCVVLHEFGHALVARNYGVNTVDIILSPIGGIARLDKLPEKPWQEFFVAIAGPLVNIGIALLLLPVLMFLIRDDFMVFLEYVREGNLPNTDILLSAFFLPALFMLNISLAVFNLIPAFPMDGGRIFRALLSIPLGRLKATQVASIVGQAFAVAMILFGVWTYSIILAIIGVFIFFSASQEYRYMRTETLLGKTMVGLLMREEFTRLNPENSFRDVLREYMKGNERNFLVFEGAEDSTSISILPEVAIIDAMKDPLGGERNIAEYTVPIKLEPISPEMNLRSAYAKMHGKNREILLVEKEGKLAGTLELHQIHFFLQLQRKLKKG